MSDSILNGINAVSCACNTWSFNGMWKPDLSLLKNNLTLTSVTSDCFNSSCDNFTSGTLAAQSVTCNGTNVTLETFKMTSRFVVNESCANVKLFVVCPCIIHSIFYR